MILGRCDIKFDMIASCHKALGKLGSSNSPSVKAAMDQVERLWVDPTKHEVLTSRYCFKQVKVDKSFRPKVKLFQVRLSGGKYRALLFIWDEESQALWLDVFVKDPTSQNAHIHKATKRVIEITKRSK